MLFRNHKGSSYQKQYILQSVSTQPSNTLCRLLLGYILTSVLLMLLIYSWVLLHFSFWSLLYTHIYPCMCKLRKTASLFLFAFVLSSETAACLHGGVESLHTTIINKQQVLSCPSIASTKLSFLLRTVGRTCYEFCDTICKIQTDNKTTFVFWPCKSLEKLFHSKPKNFSWITGNATFTLRHWDILILKL